MKVTIFKNIHTTSTPFYRDVDVVLSRIKDGKSKALVERIRGMKDKETRNKTKRSLPSICFSGKFRQRANNACLQHSGLICLDFDGFENEEKLSGWRERLMGDKYTFALFTSPSGDGLKVIVKIPQDIKNHSGYFAKLMDYYDCHYFDKATKEIARVCYESYDPDLFYNKESELWDKRVEDEHHEYQAKVPTLPLRSNNQIIQKLEVWFNKNYSVSKGSRNQNLFVLASAFNDFGVPENEAYSYMGRYVQKDFSVREVESVVKSAYSKKNNHASKYFEDNETKDSIQRKVQAGTDRKRLYKEFPSFTPEDIDQTIEEINTSSTVSEFWYFDDKGKCQISNYKFKVFLEQHGFCKYYPEGSVNYIFIKIDNSFIENTSAQKIKDFVMNYLMAQDTMKPYELMASATKYFRDDYLSLIKDQAIKLYEDSDSYAMIYYRNCAVKVLENRVEEIDYLNLDGMVWRDHVIDRDYNREDYEDCLFDRFIGLVANKDEHRKLALQSTIGYLMHSYKTSAHNRAVIFNDEKISENPNGGSGKGLICSAISRLKRVCILDGKQFDFNKSFPYQTVSVDTQLLIFDDVKKNFNFEALFSLITEGITLEKKNKDAIKIPVHKSPKILITTNYTIGGVGGSSERRKHEVELSSYFSVTHTPQDEFGVMLFDDFDGKEWNRFDNFMFSCFQIYLKNGLVKHKYENLGIRKFINDTSFEFHEWIKDGNVPTGERLYKGVMYEEFLDEYPDFRKFLSQKKFAKWLDSYSTLLGVEIEHGKSMTGRWVEIGDVESKSDFFENINRIDDEPPF